MFALAVDFLTGRYVATAYNDRRRAEWPPHPARLFSAMVAAWGDGEPGSTAGSAERDALEWLERLDAPTILADPESVIGFRTEHDVFVPVNDVTVIGTRTKQAFIASPGPKRSEIAAALSVMPEGRLRQARRFPVAVPEHPLVIFVWEDVACPTAIIGALVGLLGRVTRLGHSASLVRVSVAERDVVEEARVRLPALSPSDAHGQIVIRWVRSGQLAALIDAHSRHQETEPRVLPKRDVAYAYSHQIAATAPAQSVFSSDLIILVREDGPRLPITATAHLTTQLRRALQAAAGDPVPSVISGHAPDGAPLTTPHSAFLSLPVTSGPHADGAILGVAIAVPRDGDARQQVLRAVERLQHDPDDPELIVLRLGELGVLRLRRDPWGDDPRTTVQSRSWTKASRRWASVTPVALDRNPGDLHDADHAKRRRAFDEAAVSVLQSLAHVGLPAPIEVDVVRSAVMPGSEKPSRFPRFPLESRKPQRVLVHVRLTFDAPVRGPVVIGSGRYLGMGLFAPVDS